jgi:hypothetical protein
MQWIKMSKSITFILNRLSIVADNNEESLHDASSLLSELIIRIPGQSLTRGGDVQ